MQDWVCVAFLLTSHLVSASLEGRREAIYLSPVDAESAAACDLDGYDLTALKNHYWTVQLPHEGHTGRSSCPVPDGYERGHVIGCTLYFTVCGETAVPPEFCGGLHGATTCMEVITMGGNPHVPDGRSHFYVITDVGTLEPMGPTSYDGFVIIREGDEVWSRHHHDCDRMEVVLEFVCNEKTEEWNVLSRDATATVRHVFEDKDSCQLKVVLGYSGACHTAPTLTPALDSCLLPPYNITGLTRRSYWYAEVDKKYCHSYDNFQEVDACTFNFAFCQSLPHNDPMLGSKCNGAAVCQSVLVQTDIPPTERGVTYSMGQYKGYTRFFFSGKFEGGGFFMEVENGSIPGCGNATKTRVSLVCNSTAVWRSQDLSRLVKVEKEDCQYHIIVPYDGACLPVLPNATSLPPSASMSTVMPTMTSSATNITSSATPPSHTVTSRSTNVSSTKSVITNSTTHVHPTSTRTITSSPYFTNSTHPSTTPTKSTLTTPTIPSATPTHTPVHHRKNNEMIMGLGLGLGLFGLLSIIVVIVVMVTVCVVVSKKRNQPLRFVNEE